LNAIFVRKLTNEEKNNLYNLIDEKILGKRAKIILLSNQKYRAIDIEKMVNMHVKSVRKWINRFNLEGINGITKKRDSTNNIKVSPEIRIKIIEIAKDDPHKYDRPINTWSLRTLKYFLINSNIIDSISHEKIRKILKSAGIKWTKSQNTVISNDPEYELKKTNFRTRK